MRRLSCSALLCLVLNFSCKFIDDQKLFKKVPASKSGISFVNAITENDTLNPLNFDYLYNGGGVAIADFNNDGFNDIFFTGNMVSSKLYLNKGDFNFKDITEPANVRTNGWALGVTVVDINQDGLMDIYVCNAVVPRLKMLPIANQLFVNQGNIGENGVPVFKEMAGEYGLADKNYSCQSAFFDYDSDGDLDMYLLTNSIDYSNRNMARPKMLNGENINTDHLYRNEGTIVNGHPFYKDVSNAAGILIEGAGLGLAISDFNQDGWPDIYCANDYLSNDLLWINNKNGTFSNKINEYTKHQSFNGMGVDIADINNDGLQDLMVVDMLPEDNKRKKMMLWKYNYDFFESTLRYDFQPQYIRNTLQLNNGTTNSGHPTFSEIGQLAGVHQSDWSWAPLMMDFDNDSYRDIIIANGYRRDITNLDFIFYLNDVPAFGNTKESRRLRYKEELKKLYTLPEIKLHNYIYKNKGDLTFEDKSTDWGFDEQTYSNGSAYGDLDNDGDMDLVFNNMDQEAGLYMNTLNDKKKNGTTHWISFTLKGQAGNIQAIGAAVKVYYNKNQLQVQENYPTRGYQSSVSDVLHFGLGNTATIDSVIVLWPNRVRQKFSATANMVNELMYTPTKEVFFSNATIENTYFSTLDATQTGLNFTHRYYEVNDFNATSLLPHLLSKNGPGIAVGDANGDGLDDCYVGGDINQPRQIFFQTSAGKFKSKILPISTNYNDMGALFFDADKDGDNDLYIVSGGSTKFGEDSIYQDRLYQNDGKGNFSLPTTSILPKIGSSGSSVIAADFDKDGDLDLFRAGMVSPGNYPAAPRSFLLRNDTKKPGSPIFTDITPATLKNIGTVSTALFTDFDSDGNIDLMLTGEWMPIVFFKNTNGKFNFFKELEHSNGWWNSLTACDIDMDGDMDYIAGNYGLNSKYKASVKEPVELYLSDFDMNGSREPILTHYSQGKKYVVPLRDVVADQMPSIKKRFADYISFADADFENSFTQKEVIDAVKFKAEVLSTSLIINNGNGLFNIQALPYRAQFSSVYGVGTSDFNQDGNPDLLLVGNFYAPESQAGRNDASVGCLLLGNGKGQFVPAPPSNTGFCIDRDAKSLARISMSNNGDYLLITNNNGPSQILKSSIKSDNNFIKIMPNESYALIHLKNGKKIRREFNYGESYLSQSTRRLQIMDSYKSIEIFQYNGVKKTFTL